MGRSMAEGVRIMWVMIALTDKGFLKEAAAETASLASFMIIFFLPHTCGSRRGHVFSRSDSFQLDALDTPRSSRCHEQQV